MIIKERIIENRGIGHPAQGLYKMILSGQIAHTAEPGQFVHLKIGDGYDPLLRRPLSIAGIDKSKEEISIFYRVAGKGTEMLAGMKQDEYVDVLGPLGKGFTVPRSGELLLIAGGIGVFPLFSLIQAIDKEQVKVKLLWGGENKQFLESAGLEYLKSWEIDLEVSTLDGSLGTKGLVTELLESYLGVYSSVHSNGTDTDHLQAAVCGPNEMLKAVTEICLCYDVPVEVSLEERMACGVGACLGCVCTVKNKGDSLKRKRVCKEGPVLDGKEVVWDE